MAKNKDKKSLYQRWWFILIVIIVVVAVINSNNNKSQEKESISSSNELTQDQEKEVSSSSQTENYMAESPKNIAEMWAKSILKGSVTEETYAYLSPDIKNKYSSYEHFNTELGFIKQAWDGQQVTRQFVAVENQIINGDSASVDVKYRTMIAQIEETDITHIEKFEFIKINNEWKLKDYYELSEID